MAHAGQVMNNPSTGQRTVFHQTAADTGGELLAIEWMGGAGWRAGPRHVHRRQEERFEVLEGRIRSDVDGQERVHEAGDVLAVPPGATHTVWNDADGPVRLLVEFRPALASETVLETLAALAATGRTRADGVPRNLLDLALVVHDYEDEIYLERPPLFVQRAMFGPLAWLGRRLGRSAVVPYPAGVAIPEAERDLMEMSR